MATGYHPKRQRKRTNIAESIFFILLVLLAAFILFQSPLFEIRQIVVKGTTLPPETIKSVSGINTGQNIFKLDREAAQKRIKYLPLIKTVEISRKLPSTVIITVIERQAVGLLPINNGFVQLDIEGVCLRKVDNTNGELPIITGTEVTFKGIGKRIESEKLATVLKVVNELPAEILPKLSEVHIDSQEQLQFYMLEGIQCKIGAPENIQQKGQILIKVLQEIQGKGKKIEYIDLSYPRNPVVKYKQ